jgi:hypothetical protein
MPGAGSGARNGSWGGRSAGCLAGVVGAISTSFLLDYPICSGRLLLYVLWFQQMLILEGVDALLTAAARHGRLAGGRERLFAAGAGTALVMLIAVVLLAGVRSYRDLLQRVPIEDVRPQLGKLQTAPDLPVIVTSCMEYQIRTLPEGLQMERVLWQPFEGGFPPSMPHGEDVWIIHSRLFRGFCQVVHDQFAALTSDAPRGPVVRGEEVLVYRTHLLTLEEAKQKKDREHQEAVRRKLERKRRRSDSGDVGPSRVELLDSR